MVRTEGKGPRDSNGYEDLNADDETMDGMQKVSLFTVRGYGSSSRYRLATGILGLLCAALLMAVIGMAVLMKRMDATLYSLNITALKIELAHLRDDHIHLTAAKAALQQDYNKARGDRSILQAQVDREKAMSDHLLSQLQTREETIIKNSLRVAQLERSCGRCPSAWELANDTCYYFAASSTIGRKGWEDARADCIRQGADLAVVDTEQKQTFIVGVVKALQSETFSYRSGYWIGLKDNDKEGAWHWITKLSLDTGYWMDGEPNDDKGNEDCAATYPTVNPLKSWNDAPCRHPLKWICEKKVTGTS